MSTQAVTPQQDWFATNAPKAASADWFEQNAPKQEVQKEGASLHSVANDPNNIVLDSYAHATERGIANIGQGVGQGIEGLGHVIAHPIDTAASLYGSAKNLASAIGGNKEAADSIVNPIKETLRDPLALGDAAGRGAGQIISNVATGEAIPPAVRALGGAAPTMFRRAILLGKTPEQAYESAIKPSTTMSTADRAAVIKTGLQEKIPVSASGLKMLDERIQDLQAAVSQRIKAGAGQGVTVDPYKVASRLADTADRFRTQVNPEADLNAVANAGNEFLRTYQDPIPATEAQAIKQGTYRQLGDKAYGEMQTATKEAQKALARGLKEELSAQIPEINGLNAQEGRLYDLQGVLERAVNRISNHQLIGIGTPIAAGAARAVTGSNKVGAVAGFMKAVLDDPAVKSRIAIMLSKGGSIPPATAFSRVNAYSDALAGAATVSSAEGGN